MKNTPQACNFQTDNEKTEPFIMLPTVDFCFKELMCSEKARKGLIAAFLNLDPKEIQETVLLNTSLRKESEAEKLGILDVRVLMYDNTQIDLEMQVMNGIPVFIYGKIKEEVYIPINWNSMYWNCLS